MLKSVSVLVDILLSCIFAVQPHSTPYVSFLYHGTIILEVLMIFNLAYHIGYWSRISDRITLTTKTNYFPCNRLAAEIVADTLPRKDGRQLFSGGQ